MSVFNISNRYANAFLGQVEDSNVFDKASEDVELIYNTLNESRELRIALASPVISEEKKNILIDEIFGGKVSKETLNFLHFVVKKNREDILFDISKRFLELRDDKQDVVNAVVTTVIELDDDEKALFEKQLEKYTNKKVRISYKIDDKIIGGFKVKIKDELLDASVSHQLELLKKRLIKEDQTLVN